MSRESQRLSGALNQPRSQLDKGAFSQPQRERQMRKFIASRHDKAKEVFCGVADAELDSVTGGTSGLLAQELQDSLVRGSVSAAGDDNWVSPQGDSYSVYPDHLYYPD
jgi:hypothetical protein